MNSENLRATITPDDDTALKLLREVRKMFLDLEDELFWRKPLVSLEERINGYLEDIETEEQRQDFMGELKEFFNDQAAILKMSIFLP